MYEKILEKEMGAKKDGNEESFREKLVSWGAAVVNLAVPLWRTAMRRKSFIFKNTVSILAFCFCFQ